MPHQPLPKSLLKLWTFAGIDAAHFEKGWSYELDSIGLCLYTPPKRAEYYCTPLNSLTFATTGGDGVHFGLLALDGKFADRSPIVMTVPMNPDKENLIVGVDLVDFLALGCRFGYFDLEQLVYQAEKTILELERARFQVDSIPEQRILLERMAREFNLSPWPNPRQRLAELEANYGGILKLPPKPDWKQQGR